MGLIISRFRRKKTTVEILDKLETSIKRIEQDGAYKEQKRKRVIGYVMAYSVGLYVLFAILYYYVYVGRSQHWLHSILCASPLLLLPVLVIFLRSGISWYFNWSLDKNRVKLNQMREEKKKILEEVMNTEKYKVAKQILDKYGGGEDKGVRPFVPTSNVPGNPPSPSPATPGQLRQRQLAIQNCSTPLTSNMSMVPVINANVNSVAPLNGRRLRSDQLPRPLLDNHRSSIDKVIDYLVKDGPSNRMALVCSQCFSHNGMAVLEEFEYVTYRCAYCGHLNPARKQRPNAPLLSPPPARAALPPPPRRINDAGSGDDTSVASSHSDSEDDSTPHPHTVTELVDLDADSKSDRPESPETVPKSDTEKKED